MHLRVRRRVNPTFYIHLALTLLIAALSYPLFTGQQPAPVGEPGAAARVTYAPITTTALEEQQVISLYDSDLGSNVQMTLDEYLVGVVAAEMPASFSEEALRAQAVAARTYCIKNVVGSGCSAHEGADACDQSNHCQAYAGLEKRKSRWGDSFEGNEDKIRYCVYSTQNQILTYEGQPITALFHSTSGGMTENVENVFSKALPYLQAVESPGEESSSKYTEEKQFSLEEAATLINNAIDSAGVSAAQLGSQLSITARYASGRVETMKVGNATATGVQMRRALGLNSANFTFAISAGTITFTTKGYGHGVGMSQVGADAMAQAGSDYRQILSHYYAGVAVEEMWPYLKK